MDRKRLSGPADRPPPDGSAEPGGIASVHASCVVIGEAGVLILGASGAGKTSLALDLVEATTRTGRFARLVSDDRTLLRKIGTRIVARPHARIAGQYELRGHGVIQGAHENAVVIRLAVWCSAEDGLRFPEQQDLIWRHGDMAAPMLILGQNHYRARIVLSFLDLSGH